MKLFLQLALIAIGITTSALSLAGTIQITGKGEVSSPPDLYYLDIKVMSICYDSTQRAKNANAQISNKLVELGKKYINTPEDKITTYPGGFVRETEYIPGEDGHNRILCERKWRTWNTVRLTLHTLSSLPTVQDALVSFLTPIELVSPDRIDQSYAQISSPQFSLTEANFNKLRKESQQAALQDAKNQFQNFDANCHFKSAKLSSLNQPSFTHVYRYASKASDESDTSTPVIPESISVTAIWNFTWEFESAPGCYN
ncbi:MAG: SIMPL domain-containing protein [Deltaproteobacteria bacterium]